MNENEFRIVRGVPTDEELAAIVGVLMLRSPAPEPPTESISAWLSSARPSSGRLPGPGPGAWRRSGMPR